MTENLQKIGFSYFTSPKFLLRTHLKEWLPALSELGASSIIYQSDFSRAIPEDAFIIAQECGLKPIVHFSSELPMARNFTQVVVLLDAYSKRGVNKIILGDRPNLKSTWPSAGWHHENLISKFLDRFIPLATHVVRIGMLPVFPPLQPGGDYWDVSFIDLVFSELKNQRLDLITENLLLSSFGYTFGKPLSWGRGGPERWSGAKPYTTPDGQEDQLGFNNYEWIQAVAERRMGHKIPVMILDAGLSGSSVKPNDFDASIKTIRAFAASLGQDQTGEGVLEDRAVFQDLVIGCYFSLEKLNSIMADKFSINMLCEIFDSIKTNKKTQSSDLNNQKIIMNYLLLPTHADSVSDVVLNKVRPVIKKLKPTVGFSLTEAAHAKKVIVYPDPVIFKEEHVQQLRSAGCSVEILPESGIEIATRLQET